jgi:hypothetical protein
MTGQAVSVAANAQSANQLAGQLYEFLDRPASVLLCAVAAAVGINVTLLIGGVAVINDQPISQANRFPIIPDDIVTEEGPVMGRMILTFRNTTAAAILVNFSLDVNFG